MSNKPLMIVLLALLCMLFVSAPSLADTRFTPGVSLSTSGTTSWEHVILPNASLVLNTTIYVGTSSSGTTGFGGVTFYYNDSTTYSTQESASQAGGTFTIINPYPGKPVDRLAYSVARIPPQYVAYTDIIDFWTRTPTVGFTVRVNDLFTNASIGGFCATFTSGSPNGTTCTPTSGTPFFDGDGAGWDGQTRYESYERYLLSWIRQPNITQVKTVGGTPMMATPWFTSSSYCSESYLNTGCGLVSVDKDVRDYYCIVTDELSQYCLAMSMSTNVSNQDYMQYCLNAVQAINASTGGYGSLTEWTVRYDNRTGTPTIDKGYTNDNAADSDLRFIIAFYNTYNNANFTDSTLKAAAKTQADTMCTDVVRYNILQTSKTSLSNSSRTIDYWPAGGGNVKASGLTANDFMYSGYYGDYLLAMGACGQMTGNSTYFTIADHIFENLLAAANWTQSTGFRVPPGRAFKWSSASIPVATCTTICSPSPYIDDPDGKRMAKVCAAEAVYREMGLTLHQDAAEYCAEWFAGFSDLDAYANEWYADGTRKSSIYAAVDTNGLATHIDMSTNITNAMIRANFVGSNQYNTGTETFDSTSCQGIYNPGLAFESYGYLISPAFSTTMGFEGASTCSGAGTPVTYTSGGLQFTLNTPVNDSNVTGTSVLLNVTVYNLNVTSSGGSPVNPPWECNFDSTSCGFNLPASGGILNITSSTTNDLNMSTYTWTNFTMKVYTPTGALGHKFAITQGGDKWILDAGCWKDENGYSVNKCSWTYDAWTEITFITNHTTNTSTVCFGGSCSTTTTGVFNVVPGQDSVQFETTYSGGKVAIENMTLRVLDSEAPTSGGSSGNATVNVTLYNGHTNAVLQTSTGVTNGSTVTYNWTGLSATNTYYWYANVSSENNIARFSNFSFTVYGDETTYEYCNATGYSITHDVEGNFSLFVHNISNLLSTPQYFNITLPFVNVNISGGYYTDFNLTAYQSVGLIGAVQLYTGNVITAFKAAFAHYENTTISGQVRLPLPAGNSSVLVNVTGNFTKNITVETTPLSTVYANATDIYDTVFAFMALFVGSPIANFSINMTGNITNASQEENFATGSTTNGSILIPALRGYSYNPYLNSSGYAPSNTSILANDRIEYYNFTLLIQNTFELYFRNESSNALLNTTTVNIELISDSGAYNYTTSSGNITLSLLTPDDYTIHYWIEDEVRRDYYTTLTTGSYQNLTLYVVDADISTFYIPVVYDEKSAPVEAATVKLLRYYVDCNCYRTVEMSRTDANGQAVLRVVPNTINYKLIISKGDYSVQTTPAKLTSSTNPYTLSLTSNPLTSLKSIGGVSRGFSFNNATNTYVYTWDDDSNIVEGACMEVVQYKDGQVSTVFNQCTSGASGSIIYTVLDTNNTRYVGNAYLRTNTEYSNYYESPVEAQFKSDLEIFGKVGVLLTLILFLALVMASSEAGSAATVVGGVIAIVIMAFVGILMLDWASIVGIIIVAGIIVYKLRS